MLALISSNMLRRKARTLATAIGIALGVGTIVALLSVGDGLKKTAGQLVHLGAADAGIFQTGVSDPTASILPVSMVKQLHKLRYVKDATPIILVIEGVKQDPAAVVFGADPQGFFAQRLVTLQGRDSLAPGSIMVGDRLAKMLNVNPGSPMKVKRKTFKVAGIYHTGIYFEDTGALINLRTAQQMTNKIGSATTIPVQFTEQAHHDQAIKKLKARFQNIQILGTPEQAARVGANGQLVQNAVKIIATLALIVGGLGVTNTMAMAVLERKRELALLSAVGWTRLRVAGLVVSEGIATSLFGAGLGLLLGVVGARWLGHALGISSVVDPHVTVTTIWQALVIGFCIGVIGSLYPAWRGTTVSGAELLKAA